MSDSSWTFARKPFWIFTHLFIFLAVFLFVNLSLWQLRRLDDRQSLNSLIEQRAGSEVADLQQALLDTSEAEYQRVQGSLTVLEADFVRIVNRSQGGAAGEHVVALAQLDSGGQIFVNRGFVPLGTLNVVDVAGQTLEVEGWLRNSVSKGSFGAADSGSSNRAPRFDVEALSGRLADSENVSDVWFQLDSYRGQDLSQLPDPVPLPELSDGSHLSYAVQWAIFAVLTVVVYVLLLRRKSQSYKN